jgi:hypothetical protein
MKIGPNATLVTNPEEITPEYLADLLTHYHCLCMQQKVDALIEGQRGSPRLGVLLHRLHTEFDRLEQQYCSESKIQWREGFTAGYFAALKDQGIIPPEFHYAQRTSQNQRERTQTASTQEASTQSQSR